MFTSRKLGDDHVDLTGVVLAASMVVGQANDPGPNYEHLKPLEWTVGTWATEMKVKEGIPGVLEKGDVVRILMKIEWGLNKNVQLVQMSFCLGDKTLGESRFWSDGMVKNSTCLVSGLDRMVYMKGLFTHSRITRC